ncbi:aconitate hydratase AcnA [Thiotrichales bacterium 19S11-10]|nr:aconitate hydratase AcnA [Thiotrichales bacterium 19S11-10]
MSDIKKKTKTKIELTEGGSMNAYSLKKLQEETNKSIERLPYSIRILVENQLRNIDDYKVKEDDLMKVLDWDAKASNRPEIPHMPARVVMQDFTGVPAVVDLASMRKAFKDAGGNPDKINPLVDTAMVVDHSVQVDHFGSPQALDLNVKLEYHRNKERYSLLKWGQKAFDDFKVVPPGMGIIHQVNLEYLAQVVIEKDQNGEKLAYPDTLVGTDSHTTMINGIGVMGWGVGGIEAEAVMLGQPYYMVLPDVVGVNLTGKLREGVTATDMVLTITELLREHGVVGKFVEFYGEGVKNMSLPDRATIANMAPEYGATMGFFPVDAITIDYLKQSNREDVVERVQLVLEEQMLYRHDSHEEPEYSATLSLDLSTVDSTLAGPKRPQDRVPLRKLQSEFKEALTNEQGLHGFGLESGLSKKITVNGMGCHISHGSVAIAAITSCTNTSNPSVLIGAGLLAKKAVERGLTVQPYVKTSLAPGSQVVTDYLDKAGLLAYLEALKFNVVGYGCTTCIGNSGSLPEAVIDAIEEGDLVVASVSSGNRNFEGRINPHVKANYLASPIHVVAYALAGTVDFNPEKDPLGVDKEGEEVYLRHIWPTNEEIAEVQAEVLNSQMFKDCYEVVFKGTEDWQALEATDSKLYEWSDDSTYIQCPPFFEDFAKKNGEISDIKDARTLLVLGDSITTDHISPAGAIPAEYPAGQYLIKNNVDHKDFNSYGSRRGNHEVMMRGTFANIRIRNLLTPGVEGGVTKYHDTGEQMYVYDAAMKYKENNTPLIVLAGKEYGTGSSRDWAAKGTFLLGVKAVIAESYERIHRSNLVGMGVLPLQFKAGDSAKSLGLDGSESFSIKKLSSIKPRSDVEVEAKKNDGSVIKFNVLARLDADIDVDYYKNGGILQTVLKNMM